jgi:hypothetical protein
MHFYQGRWPSCALVALTAFTTSINAHTWVEQLNNIDPNGTFVGAPGFPRGNGKNPFRTCCLFTLLIGE